MLAIRAVPNETVQIMSIIEDGTNLDQGNEDKTFIYLCGFSQEFPGIGLLTIDEIQFIFLFLLRPVLTVV